MSESHCAHFLGKTLLIANPAAQSGAAEAVAQQIAALLRAQAGDALEVVYTERALHATEIAAARGADFDTVIALGGDGVIHEAAAGLLTLPFEARPVFGIVPVGSGNDYARTLNISTNPQECAAQLIAGKIRILDVGKCNDQVFVETCSFGLDAAIAIDTVERRKRTGKTGLALYAASGYDQLFHNLHDYRFEALLDEERVIKKDAIMFAVQNGRTYGGGFPICPDAQPDDGVFDICYMHGPVSTLRAAAVFGLAMKGKHVGRRGVCFDRAKKIHIEFDVQPACQLDGEAYCAQTFDIEVVPHALRVLVG